SPLGAVVMLEGFEGNVLGVPHAPGLPAGDPVHRVDGALVLRVLRRAQQVVVLSAIKADGYGIVTEQVRYRRAVQAHVVQGWADALAAGLADVAAQLQTAGLLEQRRIEPGETVQSVDVDEQELFLEGVVFLQAAITGEGIDRVGDQSLLRVEATGLQPVGGDLQSAWSTVALRQRQGPAVCIQQDQLYPVQLLQQIQVEHLADVALAGQMQAQALQVQIAQTAVADHRHAQAEQGAFTLDRVIQPVQLQGQDLHLAGGAESAGD